MQNTIDSLLIYSKSSLSLSLIKQTIVASIIGSILLYGVGFSSIEIAHNAAHDARHAFSFPCH